MSDDDKNRLKHTVKPKVEHDQIVGIEVDSKDLQEIEVSVRVEKELAEKGKRSGREDLKDQGGVDAGAAIQDEVLPKADILDKKESKEKDKGKEKDDTTQGQIAEVFEKKKQLDSPRTDNLQTDASEPKEEKPQDERTSDEESKISKEDSNKHSKEHSKESSKENLQLETKVDRPAVESSTETKPTKVERDQKEVVEKKDLERVFDEQTELSPYLYATEFASKQNKSVQIEKLSEVLPVVEHLEVSQQIFQELKPLEVYIAARQDIEMVELVRQYAEVRPYEAVQNLKVAERPDLSVEKKREVQVRGIEYEAELPKVQEALERKGITGIHCDNEAFGMIVPVPVGLKLAELGTLEPETMEFLHEKFGYLQDLVPQSQLEKISGQESVNTLREAVEHGRKEMKPRRTDPYRQARAEKQIEVIQEEIWESTLSARSMNYMYAVSKCDCRDGYYVFWTSDVVGYETIWNCVQSKKVREKEPERLSDRDDLDRDDS